MAYYHSHNLQFYKTAGLEPIGPVVEPFEPETERLLFKPAAAANNNKDDTPTLAEAVKDLFSHLAVKVGFVACKLRVWCPQIQMKLRKSYVYTVNVS